MCPWGQGQLIATSCRRKKHLNLQRIFVRVYLGHADNSQKQDLERSGEQFHSFFCAFGIKAGLGPKEDYLQVGESKVGIQITGQVTRLCAPWRVVTLKGSEKRHLKMC